MLGNILIFHQFWMRRNYRSLFWGSCFSEQQDVQIDLFFGASFGLPRSGVKMLISTTPSLEKSSSSKNGFLKIAGGAFPRCQVLPDFEGGGIGGSRRLLSLTDSLPPGVY